MRFFSSSFRLTQFIVLSAFFALIAIALAQTNGRDEPDQLLTHDSFERSPAIVSTAITVGYSELAYAYPVEISNIDGFPVEFALDVAPAGMTIDLQTGLIEWSTPQVGLHEVAVLVWDTRAHFDEQGYTLEIIEGLGGPQIVSDPPATVELNALYDYQPEVLNPTSLPLDYELLIAPPGMSIDEQTGQIRWLADTQGAAEVVWTVSDTASNRDTQTYTLTVTPRTGDLVVGGQAFGLELSEIVLHETVSDQRLRLNASGPFAFPIGDGSNYNIEIAEQSAINAVCFVAEPAGQISGGDVSSVVVQCVPGSADPDALMDEAETLADSGVTITTEQFEQTDYAQNQLPEADSAKIDRNHALVLSAVDPDPDWISTGLDIDRIVVTNAGREHIINAVKLDIDFNELGPVDAERLKFNIRIQREDHEFEWLPREFATDIVQWTGLPGQFVVRVPDDLTRGRLVIGLRPDFDDVGQTAIAERWSEALQFEIWPVRPGVVQLDAADVLFPVDFEQPLDPASSFSLADIQTVTQGWMDLDEMILPLVIQSATPLAVDDLVEYKIGDEPYSGRVASVELRDGQQFVLLYPDWLDVYDIADADDDFLVDQGVLPELITFRVGDRVPDFDAQYREFVTTLDPPNDQNPRIVEPPSTSGRSSGNRSFFERNCSGGGQSAALVFSPKISLVPFEAKLNVSVATGGSLLTVNCSWNAFPERKIYIPIRAAGPVAIVAEKLLGTNVSIRPIGGVQFSTDGEVSAIEAFKMSLSSKDGIKANVPTDLINLIDFHSLDGNPVSGSTSIGGNLGVAAEANVIDDRGLFAKLIKLFTRDFELEIGLEASATIGAGLSLSSANAPAVYSGLGSTRAGLSFNFCSRLGLSRALRNLFVRLIRFDPSVELCFRDSIPLSDPASQFSAEDIIDDLQGNARVQTLTALPALSSFFGFNATGRLAPDDVLSSVFNDVHNEINYELTECENNPSGDIQTPVIACAGILCGRTEPIKLCATSLWVNPVQAEAVAGERAEAETDFGVTSRRGISDAMLVEISGGPLISDRSIVSLTQSRPQKTVQASAQCGPTPSIQRGEITVESGSGDDMLEASNLNLLSCRCAPGASDCDRIWGSPHLLSPDGLALDYYASGDYLLSHIPDVDGMQVQARYLPGMGVSWPQAVALQVGPDVVEIHSQAYEPLPGFPISHRLRIKVNGAEIVRPAEWSSYVNSPILNLPGGGLIYINQFIRRFQGLRSDPIRATVLWPQEGLFEDYGVIVEGLAFDQSDAIEGDFDDVPPIMEVTLVRPDALAGLETGMLGNNDGDPSNDMPLRNGTQIEFSENLSWTELYALFGASWLVRPDECLFADGCLDPEFPLSPEPIDPDRRQFAEAACFELQGWYREACIHDVALSGSTELVEGLYENNAELNSMADRLVLPGVDIPLFELQPGAVEKVGFKEMYHFSVELIEGQGEYALSLIPPRGTSAVLASTGQGSLVDSQPRVDRVELTCIPSDDWKALNSGWPEQGSLQLWAIDPLSGSPRTMLGEIILPAERIGEFCTDLRDEVDSTFMQNAELNLQNVGPEPLTVRIQPAKAIELAPQALNDLTLCPGCDLNLDLAHQCTGGIQKLGDLNIYGSDDILQETRPIICKTIASTVSPLLDMDNVFQGQTEVLFIDETGQLWDLHSERESLNSPHPDLFWADRPEPIHTDTFDQIELIQIVSGGSGTSNPHALALDAQGRVWSWGYNGEGQLGTSSCWGGDPEPCINESEEPLLIPPSHFDAPIVQIAGSNQLSFALDANGQVWSWGANFVGGLGNGGDVRSRSNPERIQFRTSPSIRIKVIAAGNAYGIALDETGQLWAWGSNTRGQLAQGTVSFNPTPEPVALDMSTFAGAEILMVSAGQGYVLVLTERGQLWGWGSNSSGELSSELPLTNLPWPQLLSTNELSGIQFKWVVASNFTTLTKDMDGQLWSWGANWWGQLGVGDFEPRERPAAVDLSMLGDASVQYAEMSGSSVGVIYDTAGRFWTWGSFIMMPNGYGHEPRPVLLADQPGTELEVEIESFVADARLFSGSSSQEAVAVVNIQHPARDVAAFRSIRLTDPRLTFADTGMSILDVPRLRPMRVAIMGSGAELCEQPGYYSLDIEIVGENDQVLAQASIALECQYSLQVRIEKRLDDTGIHFSNTGVDDVQVTVSGLDGLTHEVLNTYEHSVCNGCDLEVQIQETCPIIGRLLLARVEVRDIEDQFAERREIDCGRMNSEVATLSDTSFIVDPEGQAWAWGESKLFGAGSVQDALPRFVETPIAIDRSMLAASGFGQMVSGFRTESHGFAINQLDLLWSWGGGSSGELGNGTHPVLGNSIFQPIPATIGGAIEKVEVIDYILNGNGNLALDNRGRVWGWGQNRYLENGNKVPADQPFPVASTLPIITRAIASSGTTSLALSLDGNELWAWGGQGGWLFPFQGAGTAEDCLRGLRVCPPSIRNLDFLEGIPLRDILKNREHTIMLDALGRIWVGDNRGSFASDPVMLDLSTLDGARVKGIATIQAGALVGINSTFLYDENQRLWAFGNNVDGLLGVDSDANSIEQPHPVAFPSEAGRIVEVALGDLHAFAVDENNCFWGWGRGGTGSPLGPAVGRDEHAPVTVLNDHSPICVTPELLVETPISTIAGSSAPLDIRLSTPYSHTQNLELTLQIVDEQIATLSTQTLIIPASETQPLQAALIEGVMPGSTRIIVSAAAPEITDVDHIASVSDPNNQGFRSVTAGANHNCAIRNDGFASCWGFAGNDRTLAPNQVFTRLSSGSEHNCGIGLEGAASCWGRNSSDRTIPPLDLFTEISAGTSHSCGIRTDQTIACWGSDFDGLSRPPNGTFLQIKAGQELSCGLTTDRQLACWGRDSLLTDLPTGEFLTVSAGRNYACAIRENSNEVVCWGDSRDNADLPPPVLMQSVSAGSDHACGIDLDGNAICWGSNNRGQSNPPAADATDLVQIAAGFRHTCALKSSGDLICWGDNSNGQLNAP